MNDRDEEHEWRKKVFTGQWFFTSATVHIFNIKKDRLMAGRSEVEQRARYMEGGIELERDGKKTEIIKTGNYREP